MSRRKLLLIFLVIIIIVVGIVIFKSINKEEKKDDIEYEVIPDEVEQVFKDKEEKILPITDMNDVMIIKSCIEKYYNAYYYQVYNSKEIIYNCLAKEYINQKYIVLDEINLQSIDFYEAYAEIYKAFIVTRNNNCNLYYVEGLVRNKKSYDSTSFKLAIVLDSINYTFEIYPSDYFEEDFFDNLENGGDNVFDYNNEVENRGYNTYVLTNTKSENYYQMLFNNIRNLVSYDIDNAVNYIDYDISNISTKEQLQEFYNNNKRDIFLMNYGTAEVSYGDNETSKIINIFDKDDKFNITMTMEGYGTYKFSIEDL